MTSVNLAFEVFDEPPASVVSAIDAGLDAHNQAAAPLGDVRPLAATAALPSGDIVDGAPVHRVAGK